MNSRSLRLAFLCFFLFAPSASRASCLDGLLRPPENGFQPILECTPSDLSSCFSEPPLLLLFDIPPSFHRDLGLSSISDPNYTNKIYSVLSADLRINRFLEYSCNSTSFPSSLDLYSCKSASPRLKNPPPQLAYPSGLTFTSSRDGYIYSKYNTSFLDTYLPEYRCVPGQPDVVKLFQFHYGNELRPYYRNKEFSFSNPTGHVLGVIRITSFSTSKFKKSKKTPKVGFDMDPRAIAPLYRQLVPDSLR